MPAITRERCPNIDPTKTLLSSHRKIAIDIRIKEIMKEIHIYSKSNNDIVAYWKRELWDEWEYLKTNKHRRPFESGISDADIARAKNYPIERIINFKHGVATAWCHADKNPSLTYWKDKNCAYCFPCQKAYDPITAIMELQDLSFTEAVKTLR